jgi:ribulose-5-phosphate 4-epimerase/fuculose-1-phosphate aldolase
MLTAMGDVMREAHRRGWVTTRDGNVSVRRGKSFYITPSGWRKTIIHPEHILKFPIQNGGGLALGQKVILPHTINGQSPSGEFRMHALLQLVDMKGPRSIVHLHPTYTIAAIHKGFNLEELSAEFPEVSRYTRVGPTVRVLPVTSDILAQETFIAMTEERAISNYTERRLSYDIVGQAGHGVCAIGKSPWDAFEHIERLEHICQIVLASGVSPK